MQESKSIELLQKYLPEHTGKWVWAFIKKYGVSFRVSKSRNSKLGDFRPGIGGKPHRISVNGDLNPYHFLLTTLHEFAHLLTWERFENSVKPHGPEWKAVYRDMVTPFLKTTIFPEVLKPVIKGHLSNVKSSSCSDPELYKALMEFDSKGGVFLEELEEGRMFSLSNGHTFTKGRKLRSFYHCTRSDGKKYRVSGVAIVEPV